MIRQPAWRGVRGFLPTNEAPEGENDAVAVKPSRISSENVWRRMFFYLSLLVGYGGAQVSHLRTLAKQ